MNKFNLRFMIIVLHFLMAICYKLGLERDSLDDEAYDLIQDIEKELNSY